MEREWRKRWNKYQSQSRNQNTPAKQAEWNDSLAAWHKGLTKAQSSLAIQIRTEKIGLRYFLHQRKVPGAINPWCQCMNGMQTAKHIIVFCRRYSDQRSQIRKAAGTGDYKGLVATARGLYVITKWILHLGILDQFKQGVELLETSKIDQDIP